MLTLPFTCYIKKSDMPPYIYLPMNKQFLKLEATEADQELTHSALPAFMVYQGGQLTNEPGINVVATELDGNEKFTDADVEWLLAA